MTPEQLKKANEALTQPMIDPEYGVSVEEIIEVAKAWGRAYKVSPEKMNEILSKPEQIIEGDINPDSYAVKSAMKLYEAMMKEPGCPSKEIEESMKSVL